MSIFGNAFKEMGTKRYTVKYLQGVEDIAGPYTGCNLAGLKEGMDVNLVMKKQLTIPWKNVLDIKAETQGEISERINMNKAAIGYLFLGPVGALLAAQKEKKDDRCFYLTIYYQDTKGAQHALIIETKQAYDIFNEFNKKWEDFCRDNGINIEALRSKVKLNGDNQLQQLNQQKAKGLISQSEYQAKVKMLSRN